MKTKTEKGRVRICFLFLDPSLSKSLFLSHPPPPAAALNPSLTALNLSPSPRRNAVQSSAAAAPLLSSPRRTALTLSLRLVSVLGKVKDFLGVMSEANKRLENDAKDHPEEYDIEELTGNESEVIEMDLMLGVADLHTPEAVAAAESAISGCQPVISLPADGSEIDSEEESSVDEDDEIDGNVDDCDYENTGKKPSSLDQKHTSDKDCDHEKKKGNRRSKKRPAIVELS
ncbi:unnamed protein product [Trifolium pratense]|uniref:Uncharacterized protein n=1 Tax=Trifolium pratense TaxID=57577 RepID=A0ACB0LIJ0_TRIPR|nr:unnamed protein product [Trifolium pratense]